MRKLILTTALALGFAAAGSLLPGRTEAMPISSPAAVQDALSGNLAEQVRYVCRRVWTGWGWRRSCWWRPNYYRYGYYYPRHYPRHYRRYYHRHHYRPYRHYRYGYRRY